MNEEKTKGYWLYWELSIAFLSFFALLILGVQIGFPNPPEIQSILEIGDHALCAVFFFDFLLRIKREGRSYLKWGWLDLLSAIPAAEIFRGVRIIRIIKVLRLIRLLRSSHRLNSALAQRWPSFLSLGMLAFSFALIICSAVAILHLESESGNIRTGEDALWWSFVTMTTVGYGDFFPTSTGGRAVGVILMTTGIGLLGSILGTLAAKITDHEQEDENTEILNQLEQINARLERIEQQAVRTNSPNDTNP